jgi:hypothetical protein
MNTRPLFAVGLALAFPCFVQSQPNKQEELPKALLLARYVSVEALDGVAFNLNLLSEDREAIAKLRGWHRYHVTWKRQDAELLIAVRKGRIGGAQGRIGRGHPPGSRQS